MAIDTDQSSAVSVSSPMSRGVDTCSQWSSHLLLPLSTPAVAYLPEWGAGQRDTWGRGGRGLRDIEYYCFNRVNSLHFRSPLSDGVSDIAPSPPSDLQHTTHTHCPLLLYRAQDQYVVEVSWRSGGG